ncbi:MAG: hypothetical protein IKN65_01040 [Clostridia bacterium]|nr:hypothetical protein [Clostridia bacterium]
MENAEVLADLASNLIEASARNTASFIANRIKAVKAKKNDKETINELEEIIQNLLEDKLEIQRIAQAYEQELTSQKITEEDIEYITNNLLPIFIKFLPQDKAGDSEQIKSLLSVETLTIMQLLGFNYKKAIGEPLTLLLKKTIESKIPGDTMLNSKWALAMANIALDKDATERYYKLIGKEETESNKFEIKE